MLSTILTEKLEMSTGYPPKDVIIINWNFWLFPFGIGIFIFLWLLLLSFSLSSPPLHQGCNLYPSLKVLWLMFVVVDWYSNSRPRNGYFLLKEFLRYILDSYWDKVGLTLLLQGQVIHLWRRKYDMIWYDMIWYTVNISCELNMLSQLEVLPQV